MSQPRTLFLVNEAASASWQYRVKWPCEVLTQHGFVADWALDTQFDSVVDRIIDRRYNVIVLHRLNWSSGEEAARWSSFAHSHGAAWAYSADDDVWGIESTDPLRLPKTVAARGSDALERDRQNRRTDAMLADAVLVSTPFLADRARSVTLRPVVTVPNLVSTGWFDACYPRARERDYLTVGWSGSFRPDTDVAELAEAWSELARACPEIRFVLQGAEHGTIHVPVLARAVPVERLSITEWQPLDAYPASLSDIDIMCCYAPADSDFARAHSPIKWMEASLAGCASVVSEAVYGQVVVDGNDALVASSVSDWVWAIRALASSQSRRALFSATADKRVRAAFSLEKNWTLWLEGLDRVRVSRVTSVPA